MIKRIQRLFTSEPPEQNFADRAAEIVLDAHNDGCYLFTKTVEYGEATEHTAAYAFEIDGQALYDQGETVRGVLRSYDGSLTKRANVWQHINENAVVPAHKPQGNKEVDKNLVAMGMAPGEYIQGETPDQFLAVPFWEEDTV